MKTILLTLTLLLSAPLLHAVEPLEKFPDFRSLSKREAGEIARRQAEADFAAGKYRVLVFGLCPREVYERYAKEKIELRDIAGCVTSDGILEGARVYNELMREKLKAKLGRDVFNDKDEARKGNQK